MAVLVGAVGFRKLGLERLGVLASRVLGRVGDGAGIELVVREGLAHVPVDEGLRASAELFGEKGSVGAILLGRLHVTDDHVPDPLDLGGVRVDVVDFVFDPRAAQGFVLCRVHSLTSEERFTEKVQGEYTRKRHICQPSYWENARTVFARGGLTKYEKYV